MEVNARAETDSSVNLQPLDDRSHLSARFTWTIDNFSRLNVKKLYSDIFYAGGYAWRVLIFPKGNNCKKDHLSIYLDAADSAILPNGWSRRAQFSVSVISWFQKLIARKETQHMFNALNSHWGFTLFMPLCELNDPTRGYLVNDTFTLEVDVCLNEEQKKENPNLHKEVTCVETGKRSIPVAEFDTLFTDIQNLVDGEASMAESLSNFHHPPPSIEETADAKKIFKQCLDMDLASAIQLGKAPELKNSLTIMLSSHALPDEMVDWATNFLAEWDQWCDLYELANQNICEAREDEKAVGKLKVTMKQLFSEFVPVRNQAEAVDREIARLDKQITERKVQKARLSKRLEDLASQATTSKQALFAAEEKMKLSAVKKEQAEKTVVHMERSWEYLKVGCSQLLK